MHVHIYICMRVSVYIRMCISIVNECVGVHAYIYVSESECTYVYE